jgi:hypothetical protein
MRTFFTGVASLALGLVLAPGARAQVENRNQERGNRDRDQATHGEAKTIRGVVAAITVEGETVLDSRTNRAATAEMSFLTIVGSDSSRDREGDAADRDRDRDQDKDRQGQTSSDRRRHNVYIAWITPKTEIRRGDQARDEGNREGGDNQKRNAARDANRSSAPGSPNFESLELGERVAVQFVQRSSAGDNPNAANRRHGRHRTYFGDARTITILSEPGDSDRDRGADRDRDRERNRNQQQENQKQK